MVETSEARLKRLTMRSWRRGMREMDLVLGPFADAELAGLPAATLDAYETLLAEPDRDLFAWISGQTPPPAAHQGLIATLRAFAKARHPPTE